MIPNKFLLKTKEKKKKEIKKSWLITAFKGNIRHHENNHSIASKEMIQIRNQKNEYLDIKKIY